MSKAVEQINVNGLTVPLPALALLLKLERQLICVRPGPDPDDEQTVVVWPASELTTAQRADGRRYRADLAKLVAQLPPCTCPRCRRAAGVPITTKELVQLDARQRPGPGPAPDVQSAPAELRDRAPEPTQARLLD